ncbi:MAG: hypothetical protein WCO55_01395 [Candidatus Falkowbacteria bacterium]
MKPSEMPQMPVPENKPKAETVEQPRLPAKEQLLKSLRLGLKESVFADIIARPQAELINDPEVRAEAIGYCCELAQVGTDDHHDDFVNLYQVKAELPNVHVSDDERKAIWDAKRKVNNGIKWWDKPRDEAQAALRTGANNRVGDFINTFKFTKEELRPLAEKFVYNGFDDLNAINMLPQIGWTKPEEAKELGKEVLNKNFEEFTNRRVALLKQFCGWAEISEQTIANPENQDKVKQFIREKYLRSGALSDTYGGKGGNIAEHISELVAFFGLPEDALADAETRQAALAALRRNLELGSPLEPIIEFMDRNGGIKDDDEDYKGPIIAAAINQDNGARLLKFLTTDEKKMVAKEIVTRKVMVSADYKDAFRIAEGRLSQEEIKAIAENKLLSAFQRGQVQDVKEIMDNFRTNEKANPNSYSDEKKMMFEREQYKSQAKKMMLEQLSLGGLEAFDDTNRYFWRGIEFAEGEKEQALHQGLVNGLDQDARIFSGEHEQIRQRLMKSMPEENKKLDEETLLTIKDKALAFLRKGAVEGRLAHDKRPDDYLVAAGEILKNDGVGPDLLTEQDLQFVREIVQQFNTPNDVDKLADLHETFGLDEMFQLPEVQANVKLAYRTRLFGGPGGDNDQARIAGKAYSLLTEQSKAELRADPTMHQPMIMQLRGMSEETGEKVERFKYLKNLEGVFPVEYIHEMVPDETKKKKKTRIEMVRMKSKEEEAEEAKMEIKPGYSTFPEFSDWFNVQRFREYSCSVFKYAIYNGKLDIAADTRRIIGLSQDEVADVISDGLYGLLFDSKTMDKFDQAVELFAVSHEQAQKALKDFCVNNIKADNFYNWQLMRQVLARLDDQAEAQAMVEKELGNRLTAAFNQTTQYDTSSYSYRKSEAESKLRQLCSRYSNMADGFELTDEQLIELFGKDLADEMSDFNQGQRRGHYGSVFGNKYEGSLEITNERVKAVLAKGSMAGAMEALRNGDGSTAGDIANKFNLSEENRQEVIDQVLADAVAKGGFVAAVSALSDSGYFSRQSAEPIKKMMERPDIRTIIVNDLKNELARGKAEESLKIVDQFHLGREILQTPEMQKAIFAGINEQIKQRQFDQVETITSSFLVTLPPSQFYENCYSHFAAFIDQVEQRNPEIITQARKSPSLLVTLLKHKGDRKKFLAILDQNPFLGDALAVNPRYAALMLTKFPTFDQRSKNNISTLYKYKQEIMAAQPELDPDSADFRILMQQKLHSYSRNKEIVAACQETGVDMDTWLDYREKREFTLGKESDLSFADQLHGPLQRIDASVAKYLLTVKKVASQYKDVLSKTMGASADKQALQDKIAAQEALVQAELAKPEAERDDKSRNKITGINKGLEALRKRAAESKGASLWEKLASEMGRVKAALDDSAKTHKDLAGQEKELTALDNQEDINEAKMKIELMRNRFKDQYQTAYGLIDSFEQVLRETLAQCLSDDRAEALIQEINEPLAEDWDHLTDDNNDIASVFDHYGNRDELEGVPMSVAVAGRNPDNDLYLGNYTNCCIRIDSTIQGAESPISDYVTDLGMQNVVLTDERSGLPVAAAWCFIGYDDRHNRILVVDNIEANNRYITKHREQIEIEMEEYLQDYAAACNIRIIIQGPHNNDLDIKFKVTHVEGKVGGYNRPDGYFLEAEGNNGGGGDEDEDFDEDDFEEDDEDDDDEDDDD